jgi:hypothetical protein
MSANQTITELSDKKSVFEMTAEDVEFGLKELLMTRLSERGLLPDCINHLETYEDAHVLTRDNGLVLEMCDGAVFHITISKARSR